MKYVLGFLFKKNLKEVALIKKVRPEWQKGLLNGVGGKIEVGETGFDAMIREFKEEAGIIIKFWTFYCQMSSYNKSWSVDVFRAEADVKIFSMEEEQVNWYAVKDIYKLKTISNLRWLIPMALDKTIAYVECF